MIIVPDRCSVLGRCTTIELMICDMFLVFMEHENKQTFDLILKCYLTIEIKKIIITLRVHGLSKILNK